MKQRISTRPAAGFTLMEVMVTVAIVAILTMVALGSYRGQTVRANRAAAVGFMLEVANKQEQFLLDNRNYATSIGDLPIAVPAEVSDNYTVTVADNDTSDPIPGYIITADPTGAQNTDDTDCGKLTLNHQGTKTVEFSGTRCWK